MIQSNPVTPSNFLKFPLCLQIPFSQHLEDAEFFEFCHANPELRIERTAHGDYEIMAPTGGETGWRNSKLNAYLTFWAEQEGSGVVFDSSTGFILPDGAIRSPDVSWVRKSQLTGLTREQKQRFLPLCPDFVIELQSPSDDMKNLQSKMQEYVENGISLGWLISTDRRQVYVYTQNKKLEILDNPNSLNGSGYLASFTLDLRNIWEVGF